jgi:hypothetical protein
MNRSTGGIPGTNVAYGTYGGTITGGAGMAAGGTVGPVGFFSDVNGLDVRVASGSNTFGLLVLDNCVPACGYKAAGLATAGPIFDTNGDDVVDGDDDDFEASVDFTGSKGDQTFVVYYGGAFGDLKLGAYLTSGSAKIKSSKPKLDAAGDPIDPLLYDEADADTKDSDKYSATSSLMDVNLSYALGAIGIAFEYWSQTQSCVSKVADGCSAKAGTGLVLGVNVPAGPGTLRAHLVQLADSATLAEDATQTNATTDMLVEFAIPVAPNFRLVPLFATRTTVTNDEVKDVYTADKTVSATFIALGGIANF